MAKDKKPLLNEGTIRRMMKLADMEAIGSGFISEKFTSVEETKTGGKTATGAYAYGKGPSTGDKTKAQKDKDKPGTAYKTTKKGDKTQARKPVYESMNEVEDDFEVAAEEEDFGGEELEMGAEEEVVEPEGEGGGEVTISEEEAQCVIDLADRLRGAVGGEEPEEDMEIEAEFGGDDLEMGAEEEEEIGEGPMYEEALYESALRGLDIALVDDKKVKLDEIKSQVYKRVVSRLLKENKK